MGGQFSPTPEMVKDHNIVYPEYLDADTPDEIVKAVRQNVLFGARVIKICVDCKPYGYTADEIRLFIREAAKVGMKVEGHGEGCTSYTCLRRATGIICITAALRCRHQYPARCPGGSSRCCRL